MTTIPIPAVCPTCGTMVPSPIAISRGGKVSNMHIGDVGTVCPNCGDFASLPKGVYSVADDVISVVVASTAEATKLLRLQHVLQQVRDSVLLRVLRSRLHPAHHDLSRRV